jgi:hypothetical protein
MRIDRLVHGTPLDGAQRLALLAPPEPTHIRPASRGAALLPLARCSSSPSRGAALPAPPGDPRAAAGAALGSRGSSRGQAAVAARMSGLVTGRRAAAEAGGSDSEDGGGRGREDSEDGTGSDG